MFAASPRPQLVRETAIGEMLETALQQVIRRKFADGCRIGDDVDEAADFRFAVLDDDGRQLASADFRHLVNIAQDGALRVERFDARPAFLQSVRLPIERPRPVMVGIVGDSTQQAAARRAG